MKQASDESAESGLDADASATGKAAREDVEDAGAGSDGQDGGGEGEDKDAMRVQVGDFSCHAFLEQTARALTQRAQRQEHKGHGDIRALR